MSEVPRIKQGFPSRPEAPIFTIRPPEGVRKQGFSAMPEASIFTKTVLDLAREGFYVFPAAHKVPLAGTDGQLDASAEVEAIPATDLCALVVDAIERHIPTKEWEKLLAIREPGKATVARGHAATVRWLRAMGTSEPSARKFVRQPGLVWR